MADSRSQPPESKASARQFSLSFLFTEVLLLSIGMGITHWILVSGQMSVPFLTLAIPTALAFFGAAIGGLFGRMRDGALCGVALFFVAIYLSLK